MCPASGISVAVRAVEAAVDDEVQARGQIPPGRLLPVPAPQVGRVGSREQEVERVVAGQVQAAEVGILAIAGDLPGGEQER